MSKLYIVSGEYQPNSAPHNRLVSFLNAFERAGVDAELVYIYPNWSGVKPALVGRYEHINVRYLYEGRISFNRRLIAKLCTRFITRRLVRRLEVGDKVFVFDGSVILGALNRNKGVEVYHEMTEHPDVMVWRLPHWKVRYLNNCKKLSGLFVISTSLKKYFANIGVPEDRIHIINMTVDPQRFEGVEKQPTDDKYIAYCGTASNNKDGVNRLIEAFAIVAKKHSDVKLYIIGKAPSETDESGNLQLVEALGIKDRVVFTGVISAKEMPQMLTNAAVLALARPNNLQAQNGFPTKLGEYLLTGNPVVVTKVGDIPLFLKDGESALLADPDSVEEFAEKLCWALEHPEEALGIGRCGRNVAIDNFAEKEASKIVRLIFS